MKRLLAVGVISLGLVSCSGTANLEVECAKLNLLVQRMNNSTGQSLGQLKIRANPIARKIQQAAELDAEAVERDEAYQQAQEFCRHLREY